MDTLVEKRGHSALALFLLAIDLFLAVCFFAEVGFVVPVFLDMFRDFGLQLPMPTQVVLNMSNIIMAFHGLGFGVLLCFGLWMIVLMYLAFNRRGDRKRLFARLWLIFVSFLLLMVIIMIAMFISPCGMGPAIRK